MTKEVSEGGKSYGGAYEIPKERNDGSSRNSNETTGCGANELRRAASAEPSGEWSEALPAALDEQESGKVNPAPVADQSLLFEGQEDQTSLEELQRWSLPKHQESGIPSAAMQTALPSTRASSLKTQDFNADAAPAMESPKDERTGVPDAMNRRKRKTHWELIRNMLATKKGLEKVTERSVREEPHPSTFIWKPKIYHDNVVRLAKDFPELRSVTIENVRHDWASRIVFYDCMDSADERSPTPQEPWKGSTRAPEFSEFTRLLRDVPPHCLQRVVLVEDLNPSLINMLGVTFQIPPHVFAEHLDRSGYNKKYEEKQHDDWKVGSSVQGHTSISWYRPVLPLIPLTQDTIKKLTSGDTATVGNISQNRGKRDSGTTCLRTVSNIWRPDLGLCCEPGLCYKGSKLEYPVGWEEKATVWTREIEGHKYCRLCVLCDHGEPNRNQ
jgi:hypothetical protein